MNNTFNIKRFLHLLAYEHRSSRFLRKMTIFATIYTLAYTILYKLHLLDSLASVPNEEIPFGMFTITLLMCIAPIIFYHPLLKGDKRLLHTMLPASNLEKYISMLANTIIIAPTIITCICDLCNVTAWLLSSRDGSYPLYSLADYNNIGTPLAISIVTFIYIMRLSKGGFITGIAILLLPFIAHYMHRITTIAIPSLGFDARTILYILVLQYFIYIGLKNITSKLSL